MQTISNKNIKTVAIMPFFNEEKHLPDIITKTLEFTDHIIAVDDGSTDKSAAKIRNLPNTTIASHNKNLGKGKAIKTGIAQAISKNPQYILILDADFQHPPEYIPTLLKELKTFDIVVGNRKRNKSSMPLHRRISNSITSKLLSLKAGITILDSQCGFRAYKASILKNILPKFSGFEAESEMLLKAAQKKHSIGFVTIPTIYADENSKIKPIQAIIGFCKVLLS